MNNTVARIGLFVYLGLLLMPEIAFAEIRWTNDPNDKSIYFLTQIFGPMSTALAGNSSSNALLGNLFSVFNIAVLTLGSLVVSYTIILSTINTAQEGEVMGKKWSSIWIPLRSAIGVAFLIPTTSGYSLIQILLMNIVVLGIAAGNQIWSTVVNSMVSGTGLFGQTRYNAPEKFPSVSEGMLRSLVCAQAFNADQDCAKDIGNKTVQAYPNGNSLVFGVPNDLKYANLCGKVTAGSLPPAVLGGADVWAGTNITAFLSTTSTLAPFANEIVASRSPTSWTGVDVVRTGADMLSGGISTAPVQFNVAMDDYSKEALSNGWMFAGSYYFTIISKNRDKEFTVPNFTEGNFASPSTGLSSLCVSKIGAYQVNATDYIKATSLSSQLPPTGKLQLQKPDIASSEADQFYSAVAGPINKLTYKLIDSLTNSAQVTTISFGGPNLINVNVTDLKDPIASLRRIGADIMAATEILWFTIIGLSFIVLLGACTGSGTLPPCWAIAGILTAFTPIFTVIVGLLWGVGAMLGIYLPMIPYLVFTFTALGWLILVIEAIAAAPIIALGLVSPSQENLGKASPAVMIITNVFLRPSLMVIALMISVKLVRTVVSMINFGFEATIRGSVGALGIFGCIALLVIYGSLIIAIIHECFSLIHVIPDKIMRWIGGSAEQSAVDVKSKTEEAKGAVDQGAKMGAEMMKSSATWASEKAQKKLADDRKGSGGGLAM